LERKDPSLAHLGCLVHASQCFYQTLKESLSETVWFVAQVGHLYRLEDQIRRLNPAERDRLRQEQAPPLWQAMKKHAEQLEPQLLPKNTLGKAVNYFLNEYDAMRD